MPGPLSRGPGKPTSRHPPQARCTVEKLDPPLSVWSPSLRGGPWGMLENFGVPVKEAGQAPSSIGRSLLMGLRVEFPIPCL